MHRLELIRRVYNGLPPDPLPLTQLPAKTDEYEYEDEDGDGDEPIRQIRPQETVEETVEVRANASHLIGSIIGFYLANR